MFTIDAYGLIKIATLTATKGGIVKMFDLIFNYKFHLKFQFYFSKNCYKESSESLHLWGIL